MHGGLYQGTVILGVSHTADELVMYDAMSLVPCTHHAPLSATPGRHAPTPDAKQSVCLPELDLVSVR